MSKPRSTASAKADSTSSTLSEITGVTGAVVVSSVPSPRKSSDLLDIGYGDIGDGIVDFGHQLALAPLGGSRPNLIRDTFSLFFPQSKI